MAKKRNVKEVHISFHGPEGFSTVHHHDQGERGVYHEPETHIHKTHGELLTHLHDQVHKHGGKGSCPICDKGEEEGEDESAE